MYLEKKKGEVGTETKTNKKEILGVAAHCLFGIIDSLAETKGRLRVPEVIHTSTSLSY